MLFNVLSNIIPLFAPFKYLPPTYYSEILIFKLLAKPNISSDYIDILILNYLNNSTSNIFKKTYINY